MEAVASYPYTQEEFNTVATDLALLFGATHLPHPDCATTHDLLLPGGTRKVTIAQTEYRHGGDFADGEELAWIPLVMQDLTDDANTLFYYIAISNLAPWRALRVLAQLGRFIDDGLLPEDERKYQLLESAPPFGRFKGGIDPVLVKYPEVVAEGQK